jgi:WD40 repeat protein
VAALACTTVEGRPVAVTGGGFGDGTVQIWDLRTRTALGDPLPGHHGGVAALACTVLEGRPVAITTGAGFDGTVQIWDLSTRTALGDPLPGHPRGVAALACTTVDGHPVAVTGGSDGTVWIWDLAAGQQIDRVDLPGKVEALTVSAEGLIVAGFGWEIVVLEPSGARSQ